MLNLTALVAVGLPTVALGQFSPAPAPCTHDPEVAHLAQHGCGKSANFRMRFQGGLLPSDPEPLLDQAEALGDTDVQHVNLELEFNHAAVTLTGTCVMTVKVLSASLSEFTIRLRNNFTITAATVNGTAVTVNQVDTSTRRVVLNRAYAANEVFTLSIAYNGPAVSRGLGSINFTTQNGVPLVASLSEPYFAYTWWPAKDGGFAQVGDNSDKFTADFSIITPSTLSAVSNGLLQGVDTLTNNRRRYRWATGYPMSTYLLAFAATNYSTWRRTYTYPGGSMPVDFYIYPGSDTPANRAAWEVVLTGLETFRPLYGLYPFINEKYGIYQFPFSGGMEHQTMTGQGGFGESLSIHELVHQWWGNDVTCRTWSDIWINEGNATYGEALWAERKPGSTGLPALRAAMNSRKPTNLTDSVYVNASTGMSDSRIFQYDTSYAKGAWVLHMLRKVVGDAAFFQAQRDVRAQYTGKAITTDQYRDAFMASTGADLVQFWDQWIYGVGMPSYAFGFQPLLVNGRHYARVHVLQTQNSGMGAGGFKMPIDVVLSTSQGPQTRTVRTKDPLNWFVVPLPATATAAALDPDDWVLNTGKTSESPRPGPPVIVESSPAPGSSSPAAPTAITLYFSDAITTNAAHFQLARGSTIIPTTFAYSAPDRRVTLTPTAALAPGTYALTVSDAITAGSLALDGDAGASLPSGDGLPGGSALITFAIASTRCPADFNDDGTVDQEDLSGYITAFLTEPDPAPGLFGFASPPCQGQPAPYDTLGYQADYNRDCALDQEDLSGYITAYFEPCG